jgi:cysteinyl-tRNA synthetase
MDDDLNTAAALGHVFGIMRLANRVMDDKGVNKLAPARDLLETIRAAAGRWYDTLGLFGREPAEFLEELRMKRLTRKGIHLDLVAGKLAERVTARAHKDFAATDAIRAELAALGVEVRDTPDGQTWDVA